MSWKEHAGVGNDLERKSNRHLKVRNKSSSDEISVKEQEREGRRKKGGARLNLHVPSVSGKIYVDVVDVDVEMKIKLRKKELASAPLDS